MKKIEEEVKTFKTNVKKLSNYVVEVEELKHELKNLNKTVNNLDDLKQKFKKILDDNEQDKLTINNIIENLTKDVKLSIKESEIIKNLIESINNTQSKISNDILEAKNKTDSLSNKILENKSSIESLKRQTVELDRAVEKNQKLLEKIIETMGTDKSEQGQQIKKLFILNLIILVIIILLKFI